MNREKEELFIELINEYKRMIYTVCYMFSSNTDDVNDLYQEFLVKLWNGFDSFEGKSNLKTWIYRVSLNYCINFSNHQEKERNRISLIHNAFL